MVFFVFFTVVVPFASALASDTGGKPRASPTPEPRGETERRIGLYSPRVRRSSVTYLKLRLLELREEGLERARAVIEHRLDIDQLLEPAHPAQKVTGQPRRNVAP